MSIFGIEISGKTIHWAIFEAAEKNKATFKFAEVKIVCLVFKNFNSKSHQQKKISFRIFTTHYKMRRLEMCRTTNNFALPDGEICDQIAMVVLRSELWVN